jgi:hypothetical protein
VTRLYRLAVVIAAGAFVSLLVVDTASDVQAAKRKKHGPAPASASSTAADPKAATSGPTGGAAEADPVKNPPSAKKPADPGKAETEAAKKPPDKWSDTEIADAKAHCAVVLKRIHAVAIQHEPIKEGACGAPAPIELVSIGQNPEVALSPPAIVRCDLAEALVAWLEGDLQPLARKYFKSPIIRMETMSSYSCRNAYGRKRTKLSEHGLANALDVGDFITASAQTAAVLDGWGTPQREILAKIAAEKAAAEKAAAEKLAAEQAAADKKVQSNLASNRGTKPGAKPTAPTATTIGAPAAGIARSTIIDGVPAVTVTLPGARTPANAPASPSIADARRLGGPAPNIGKVGKKSKRPTSIVMHPSDAAGNEPEARAFLHEAHAAACRIFGTTLGPEANADHRNHFHVDMAPRKFTKICD